MSLPQRSAVNALTRWKARAIFQGRELCSQSNNFRDAGDAFIVEDEKHIVARSSRAAIDGCKYRQTIPAFTKSQPAEALILIEAMRDGRQSD